MGDVFVYVLVSLKDATFYVGISKDPNNRLIEHNSGKTKYTSGHLPYKLIYCSSAYSSYADARIQEKKLKSKAGKCFTYQLIIAIMKTAGVR
jgi:predicted GIY-YIG superfamily endonuclease